MKLREFGGGRNITELAITTIQGDQTKIFVGSDSEFKENIAKALLTIDVVPGSGLGGFVQYTIEADENGDALIHSGIANFVAINHGGAVNGNVEDTSEVVYKTNPGGAFKDTWTAIGSLNQINLVLQVKTGLTNPKIMVRYQVFLNSLQAIEGD